MDGGHSFPCFFGFQVFPFDQPSGHFHCFGLAGQKMGGDAIVPSFAWEVIKMLGACSIPVGLLLIGGNISDLMKGLSFRKDTRWNFHRLRSDWSSFPLFCFCTPGKGQFQRIWTGYERSLSFKPLCLRVFALVVVRIYEGDRTTAMRAIMATMLGSLLSLPTWLFFGLGCCLKISVGRCFLLCLKCPLPPRLLRNWLWHQGFRKYSLRNF